MKNFSVVMSVYAKDNPVFFRDAFNSVLHQTTKPNEIIITVDGPVGESLNNELEQIVKIPIVKILKLEKNVGLAAARKQAIDKVNYEIFAVMDSDDISSPKRFEKQLPILENGQADVVGGWISEFEVTPGDLKRIRKVPADHAKILTFGKWRNPINHVTLMFNKEAYDRVGGYSLIRYNEDWELIVRMLLDGATVKSIPDVLVSVRAGEQMVIRRRMLAQFRRELEMLVFMYRSGFINVYILLANITSRVILRILPKFITALTYKYLLRK